MPEIKIEISARHIHLSQKDSDKLFGKDYKLKKLKNLSQKGQFACQEKVKIKTSRYEFPNVRILGPVRKHTQIEISTSDAYKLGLDPLPPVRESGDLKGSAGIKIVGPKGRVNLKRGVIIAQRHIHASPQEAKRYHLKDNQVVSVKVGGERGLTFHKVIVRVRKDFVWRLHVDTDEGNAAGITAGVAGAVIIK